MLVLVVIGVLWILAVGLVLAICAACAAGDKAMGYPPASDGDRLAPGLPAGVADAAASFAVARLSG